MKTKCARFPRLAKCLKPLGESSSAAQQTGLLAQLGWKMEFSEEEMQDLILSFGEAEDLKDGGWILTDGTVLDLKRSRQDNTAVMHSKLFNGMSQERREILLKIQPRDQLLHSSASVAVDAALAAGFIRYQMSLSPSYFTVYLEAEKAPTPAQMRVIRELVSRTQEEGETSLAGSRFTGMYECGGVHGSFDDPALFGRSLVQDLSQIEDAA